MIKRDIRRFLVSLVFFIFILIGSIGNVEAYIGPGAGFAFLSSFLSLFIAFALALIYLFSWPFRLLRRALFS